VSSPASSAATGIVLALSSPPTKPSSTSLPVIAGAANVGQTLSASTGAWSGTAPISFAYQWQRCARACVNITRATRSLTLTAADQGTSIRVLVTASNHAGSAHATSKEIGPVAGGVVSVSRRTQTVGGTFDVQISLPAPGKISARAQGTRARKLISSVTVRASGHRTVVLHITPSAAANRLLASGRTVKITVSIAFTPSGGQRTTQTVTVSLKRATPSNKFTVRRIDVHADGTVTFELKLPGPGQIDVMESAWKINEASISTVLLHPAPGRFIFSRKHINTKQRGTIRITVTPNARGRLLVADNEGGALRIRLWVTYQPTGGHPRSHGFYGLLVAP
jgi:uncharacterized protein YggU (UPF0235/DUF167 family)